MISFTVKIENYPEGTTHWLVETLGFTPGEWTPISQKAIEVTSDILSDGDEATIICSCYPEPTAVYLVTVNDGATYIWDVIGQTFTEEALLPSLWPLAIIGVAVVGVVGVGGALALSAAKRE